MDTALADRIVDLTTDLVAIPTHETEQVAQEHLADVLEEAGFSCSLQEVAPLRPNLVATRGDGGTFVCSHMDTHPPHAHPEPFTCRRRGEIMVGRGVLDAKGQIAALVAAVEAAPDVPVTIAITCDEEFGGLGSERIELPDGPWHTEGGIVLEPTAFRMCTVQGGHMDLTIEASAPPTHAYASAGDRSPIDVVVDAVEALREIPSLLARHPMLPAPRVHLGKIRGGEHLWRTPAGAHAEVGVGLVPQIATDDVRSQIVSALDGVASRWDVEGGSFLYDIRDESAAIELPEGLPIVARLASAIGSNAQPAGMNSWTDAAHLLVHHGLPCVVFGAGELDTAHSNHEWVEIGDLVRLAKILSAVLRPV